LALCRDVTDRNLAQEALRQSEERLRLAVEATRMGVAQWNIQTNEVFCSDECLAIIGLSDNRQEFDDLLRLVHPDDRQRVLLELDMARESGRDFQIELRISRPDGERRWVAILGRALRASKTRVTSLIGAIQDITERKQAEERIRRTEQRFRTMADHAPVLVWMAGEDRRCQWFNRPWLEFTGQPMRTLVGQGWQQCVHAEDLPECLETYRRHFAKRQPFRVEYRLRRHDGQDRWILDTGVPLYDAEQTFRGYLGSCVDITDRREMEAALRESELRHRRLVSFLPDAVYITHGGRIVFCNPALLELVGADSEQDIIGREPFDLFHKDYHDLIRERIQQLNEGAPCVPGVDEVVMRRDGRTVQVHVSATRIMDQGRPSNLVVLHDLSQRRRAEKLLSSVMRSVPDAIITIDSSDHIESVNPAAEKLFGYSSSELIGRSMLTLIPESYHEPMRSALELHRANLSRSLSGSSRQLDDVEGQRRDGTTFPAEVSITEFELDGVRHFLGVVRDVSERKKLEAQFHHSQKMEAVGRMAGGIAHDFNNLLTVIAGFSEVLLLQTADDEVLRPSVESIQQAAQRATDLTRQLLAFSRKQVLAPAILDLNAVIRQAESFLRRFIGTAVHLEFQCQQPLASVRVDRGQIEQVLMNLAVNACDAMPSGGRLTVATRNLRQPSDDSTGLTCTADEATHVELTVADTGLGIPPGVLDQIFEPFFTTKELGKGTGLGLSVVHGIVTQSDGQVSVDSSPIHGTTFRVVLPAVGLPVTVEQIVAVDAAATAGNERVLVVDDEPGVRQIAAHALRTCGYDVHVAANGDEALSLVESQDLSFDLLITDVVMPGAGGRQLATEMARR
ncbi:MAG: PAS domain S-box protein, partial [Planctomycetales bacterium]|nr:PAS domain S-box protein [Planctomycetales bacterium]